MATLDHSVGCKHDEGCYPKPNSLLLRNSSTDVNENQYLMLAQAKKELDGLGPGGVWDMPEGERPLRGLQRVYRAIPHGGDHFGGPITIVVRRAKTASGYRSGLYCGLCQKHGLCGFCALWDFVPTSPGRTSMPPRDRRTYHRDHHGEDIEFQHAPDIHIDATEHVYIHRRKVITDVYHEDEYQTEGQPTGPLLIQNHGSKVNVQQSAPRQIAAPQRQSGGFLKNLFGPTQQQRALPPRQEEHRGQLRSAPQQQRQQALPPPQRQQQAAPPRQLAIAPPRPQQQALPRPSEQPMGQQSSSEKMKAALRGLRK
jgi:hypothetical protein